LIDHYGVPIPDIPRSRVKGRTLTSKGNLMKNFLKATSALAMAFLIAMAFGAMIAPEANAG
jgi:hypothetical protein